MMLQANFMRALMRWRSKLDETYGFPPVAMAAHLVELVKRIYKVHSIKRDPYDAWKGFFTILQYERVPSMVETEGMLRTAISHSRSKGYHRDDRPSVHRQISHNKDRYIPPRRW
ncbi:hypothetical protein GOP47_0006716 [Adiantum capillus-veneris]|uniref:Uncharacterized protein n=1 Tax=Adiantum capillus-veneris TaxID=13818 RepID=A0A9D4ZNA4_ADICA|nr:hypothetical protein GOP47_0006716 [Adiantum capillus-veneris]